MKKILSDSGFILAGQMVTSLTAFAGMVFIANMVTAQALGEYRYILAVLAIAAIATLPGLDTALVRSTAQGYTGQLSAIVKTKILWGLWGMLGMCAFGAYYIWNGQINLGLGFIAGGLFAPLYGSFFSYFFLLQGKSLFNQAAIINSVSRIIFLLILFVGVWAYPTTLGVLVCFLLAVVLSHLCGYLYTHHLFEKSVEKKMDEDVIPYGKELTYLGAWNIVTVNADKVIVWFMLGPIALAVYTIATLIPLESIRIGRILSQVMLPRFTTNRGLNPTLFIKRLGILSALLFGLWLLFALLAPWFFTLFFKDYAQEATPLAIVAMLLMLSTPAYIVRSYFTAIQHSLALRVLLIGIPTIKTVLLATMLYQYNIWGGVWAIAIGGLIELVISLVLLFRYAETANQQS